MNPEGIKEGNAENRLRHLKVRVEIMSYFHLWLLCFQLGPQHKPARLSSLEWQYRQSFFQQALRFTSRADNGVEPERSFSRARTDFFSSGLRCLPLERRQQSAGTCTLQPLYTFYQQTSQFFFYYGDRLHWSKHFWSELHWNGKLWRGAAQESMGMNEMRCPVHRRTSWNSSAPLECARDGVTQASTEVKQLF